MALSFQRDIKPLFTEMDRDHMMGSFDLWDYMEVKNNADAIYDSVKSGSMPPPDVEPTWDTAKVAKFKQWIDEGYPA